MTKKIVLSSLLVLATASLCYSAVIKGLDGKCLDRKHSGTANGTNIWLWGCNGTGAQDWKVTKSGEIKSGGKCLDVEGNNSANGTNIILWECHGGDNQKWKIVNGKIKSKGKCLDVEGNNSASGTNIQLYSCKADGDNDANQKWKIE